MADEALLRLSAFAGVFAFLAVCEAFWPMRELRLGRRRWIANIGLSAANTVLVRALSLVLPVLGVAVALYAESRGWGLLRLAGAERWIAFAAGFLVLDLAIYWQHVAFHYMPWLWRLHRVHHADVDFDVTTGIRFHPIEILASLAYKLAVIAVFGVSATAVLVFEIVLNATSMFSHSNLRLPGGVDRALRLVLVTPGMHRIHHSVQPRELNSNFGFNLAVWDRLFGSYKAEAAADPRRMELGLGSYRGEDAGRFLWLLRFPFMRGPSL